MWTTIRHCEHGLCASSQRRRGAVERGDEPRDPSLAGARPGPRHGSRSRVANDKTRREPTDRSDMRRSVAEQTQRSAVTSNPTVAWALAPALGPRRGVANHVPARRRSWALANDGPTTCADVELPFRGHDNLAEFKRCLRNSFNSLPAKYR